VSDETVITALARLLHLPDLDARQARRVRAEGGCVVDEDGVKEHVLRIRIAWDAERAKYHAILAEAEKDNARLAAQAKVLEEALRWLNDWLESSRENVDEARDGMARVRAALAAKEGA
jgi:hypothetical protein